MIRQVPKLDRYMYRTSDITITITGQTDPIIVPSGKVKNMTIIKNFDQKIISFISLVVEIPKQYYQQVATSLSDLTVTFTTFKYKVNDNDLEFDVHCFDGTFKAMNQDVVDPKLVGAFKGETSIDVSTSTQDTLTFKMFLYDSDKLDKMRTMFSLFIDGDINDVLYHSFAKRGFSDVLMTQATAATDFYKIPYTSLVGGLRCINNVYGLYDTPYTFFMDFSTTYLIDRGNVGKTLKPLEIGTVAMYLEENGSRESADVGCFIDDTQMVVNLVNIPTVDYVEDDIDYYEWSKLIGIISGTTTVTSVQANTSTTLERAVVVNNAKLLQQEASRLDETREMIASTFIDVDIDMFTPNKIYKLIAHSDYDPKYKLSGNYRMTHCIISMLKHGESGLQSTTSVSFKKLQS